MPNARCRFMLRDMSKYFAFILLFTFDLHASCLNEYERYKWRTLIGPARSVAISSGSTAMGSALSLGGSTMGLLSSQTELTTAGALYSVAFAYEGQYYLEGAWWDLRNYESRRVVKLILRETQVGGGPQLQEFLSELNQLTITGDYFTMDDLVQRIILANQERILCPIDRGVFTLKNLENHLLASIGQGLQDDLNTVTVDNNEPIIDEDEYLDDYWDFFDN